jgi:hypothetical protein
MSWIEYYGLAVLSWLLLCFILMAFKRTRLLAVSAVLSTLLLFLGVKIISKKYNFDANYQANKRTAFVDALKENEEIALNISPASWLLSVDGRSLESLIPYRFRDNIGGYFPLGSAPNVKTFYCIEDDGFISYKTDRYGFRNNDKLWNTASHDILILGDSFAESACVPNSLQTNFSEDLKTLSLGKGGNGPLTSLAAYMEYGKTFNAKSVYFLIVSNDYSRPYNHQLAIDLERELSEEELEKYLTIPNHSVGYFTHLDLKPYRNFAIKFSKELVESYVPKSENKIEDLARFFFYDFVKKTLFASNFIDIAGNNVRFRVSNPNKLKRIYTRANEVAKLAESRMVFVPLPDKKSSCTEDPRHSFLTEILVDLDVDVLDLWATLCDERFFALNGGHFNSFGYEKLATLLEAEFKRNFSETDR